MPFIALTGNFGMGKSTVLSLFKKSGVYTINADAIVLDIFKKPLIIKKLSCLLGKEVLTKKSGRISINKKAMANIIFDNPQKRALIEKIIHPEVIKSAERFKTEIMRKDPSAIIIFEVPLLFESGYEGIFDKIIVVYCSKEIAISRLLKKGFSRKDILKRMQAQMPISRKKTQADFLINNNFDINNTKRQVKEIFNRLITSPSSK